MARVLRGPRMTVRTYVCARHQLSVFWYLEECRLRIPNREPNVWRVMIHTRLGPALLDPRPDRKGRTGSVRHRTEMPHLPDERSGFNPSPLARKISRAGQCADGLERPNVPTHVRGYSDGSTGNPRRSECGSPFLPRRAIRKHRKQILNGSVQMQTWH